MPSTQKFPRLPSPPLILNPARLLQIALLVVAVAVLGWGGYRGFRHWQQGYLVRQARHFLGKSDLRRAALSAREALQLNASNIEASRIMAEIAETVMSPAAVSWRGRMVALQPGVASNSLAWASIALRFGENAVVDEALLTVPPEARHTAAYHELAGAFALAVKQRPLAEFHYAAAARLEPQNELHQLNLAAVRLLSSNVGESHEARAVLERLRAHPQVGAQSARVLIADAMRNNEMERALGMARDLQADPKAPFRDRMLYLDVLHRMKHADFPSCLCQLQQRACQRPSDLAAMVVWMNANDMAAQALAWIRGLPVDWVARQPVPLAMAEAYAAIHDWTGLQSAIGKANWEELDFVRLAFLARADREAGDTASARIRWRLAVTSAFDQPGKIAMLARMAHGWGWKDETEDLCWSLAEGSQSQHWALQKLFDLYRSKGDTRGLRRVVSCALEINPSDAVARNDFIVFSLLLNVEVAKACRMARELHGMNPSNAVFASTYAFSLHCQGRTAEGLKVLSALKESERRSPSVAAYYGILLAAQDMSDQARQYLDLADQATLLPEEKKLLAEARQKLK